MVETKDKGGTLRSEIPDIGFVGFYRGPYWGVMEMQARFLGEQWAGQQSEYTKTEGQRQSLRTMRLPDTNVLRGQFPMGDYVGLMEAFAKDLNIRRTEWWDGDSQSGPVAPARYVHNKASRITGDKGQTTRRSEARQTLEALKVAFGYEHHTTRVVAALAIFRALHGTWKFTRVTSATGQVDGSGSLAFHPRCPSNQAFDREYVCEEYSGSSSAGDESSSHPKSCTIFRLSEAGTAERSNRIEIWSTSPGQSIVADTTLDAFLPEEERGWIHPGEYVIYANRLSSVGTRESSGEGSYQYQYTFHFKGVSISTWECIDKGDNARNAKTESGSWPMPRSRTMYER